jgi:hypothetical protein
MLMLILMLVELTYVQIKFTIQFHKLTQLKSCFLEICIKENIQKLFNMISINIQNID